MTPLWSDGVRRMGEPLAVSAEALGRYKLRTALSVLGVVLGVGAVIAMVSVSDGARLEALRQVEHLGLSNIIIRTSGRAGSDVLQVRDVEHLRTLVPQVEYASPLVERVRQVGGPVESRSARVIGVHAEYGDTLDLHAARGRFLTEVDERSASRVAVLGSQLSRTLFGYADPVGERVRAGQEWYSVVGVLSDRPAGAQAVRSAAARDLNRAMLVPFSSLLGTRAGLEGTHAADEIWLHVRDPNRVVELGEVVEHTLNRQRGSPPATEVIVPRELLEQRVETQRTFNVVVGSVALLSLVVGGIGIMNIMLASVLERTKEIGVRRTVGATRRDITLQFLTESLLMALSGGVIGIALGVVVSYAITAYAEWHTHVSLASVFLAVSVSCVVGVVFGWYPAMRAARLAPIDAVRYE